MLATPARSRVLYAAVIEKSESLWGEGAVERATAEVCRRFDIRLTRLFQESEEAQRGLLVLSEGRLNARAKLWVHGFRERGTQWGAINNLADIPYFASTKESRLLQAADQISHAVWLRHERRDARLIGPLLRGFDRRDGILHGLVHVRSANASACDCPACASRRSPGGFGPWVRPESSSAPESE